MLLILLPLACTGAPEDTGEPVLPPEWLAEADPIACTWGAVDTPLLDAALEDAVLTADEVVYTNRDIDYASYDRYLDDPFKLSWFDRYHRDPLEYPCFAGQVAADLDHAGASTHPVSVALGEAMALVDVVGVASPIDPATASQDLVDLSALPADLRQALVPILAALVEVAAARAVMEDSAPEDPEDLVDFGHGGVIIDYSSAPDLTDEEVQTWILSESGPRALYDPARVLAHAVEHADLGRFAGQDTTFDQETHLGRVIVSGPGSDSPGDLGPVAFYLDLGGDDLYTHPVAASSVDVPAAVHVDLGGDDVYTYEEDDEGTENLLPSDDDGRYRGDDYYGPFSLSLVGRQGSGRFGVGLLFDFGAGQDHYQSLRMSQGWGHLGVGVAYDDGGDDTWLGEAGVQGAASMGLGLLIDAAGNDTHGTFTDSQGFAYVQAAGLVWDGDGRDTWFADPGKAEDGGTTVYYSPQLAGNGNSSFSQGAGFGQRNDAALTFLSGGIGVLRDAAGSDAYTAGTFAQGTGYWQGTGLLLDGAGDDAYDAYYYVQGGAAHYATGVLLDDGDGADRYNTNMTPNYVQLGTGHDYSIGMMINEAGDDTYVFAGLAAGASNCQGMGFFVDNDGADSYTTSSTYGVGLGNMSGECDSGTRKVVDNVGLFLDSGGDTDTWSWPADEGHPVPGDDSSFGYSWNDSEYEHGGAVDGDGETGLHAGG